MAEPLQIKYTFILPNREFIFDYRFDAETFELIKPETRNQKDWVKLDYYQCSHCPLSVETHPNCPVAEVLDDIIEKIDEKSFDKVLLQVDTEPRRLTIETSIQRAVGSLMGLIIPTCGCPHANVFRPMARFHLPLSDSMETIYRTSSMYLLAQYFKHKDFHSMPTDLAQLDRIYDNIRIVNVRLCARLRSVCEMDSSMNAVVVLDNLAVSVKSALEDALQKIEPLFSSFAWKDV